MKRCTKCILPETFPGIKFDENGICNICKEYKPIRVKGEEELLKILDEHRSKDGRVDCAVTYSGGRDSSYILHQLVKKYDMTPIAITYDWGMMTPEAHRNWERMKKKLGVEHVVIQPNIKMNLKYIRKNLKTWLNSDHHIGMLSKLTLFDKYAELEMAKVVRKRNIALVVTGANSGYEVTRFKSLSFGASDQPEESPGMDENRGKIPWKLAQRYLKEHFKNPGYINGSLLLVLKGAYRRYYKQYRNLYGKADLLNFFPYIKWNEDKILSTIRKDLDWESPKDTPLTWRTDDCTPCFYNYVYCSIYGFTENDTFRSIQIRERGLTKEKALKIVYEENRPRMHAIDLYLKKFGFTIDDLKKIPINYKYNDVDYDKFP